ncbi:TolC family protein [Variovorax arabinosiphilus]|uniref:TolC family protein n=1 Tax=Variovorax arabinosiphilus TaxID=3053498 RepID=UPI0025756D1E|nr:MULTISPECIES: TolC family protein [unclassified Variovorax]MDM0119419.1 TolC family protein [Variovorax sp. J2L1-78]MDM0129845.1 TolC family protein [Variovorax sp. J2L1-63]MDM0232369.1 TolC family protein [Variovorax sp. J2R1-6]
MKRALRSTAVAAAAVFLAGCASVGIDEALKDTNTHAQRFTGGNLALSRTPEQRDRRAELAQQLLATPLSQDDAVQLALTNSPAVQALMAQSWVDIAAANQTSRLPNPIFTFERMRLNSELELGRLLSFGLVDLILLPQRLSISRSQAHQAKLQLTGAVVDHVTQVRQAWVRAVAAQQSLHYAEQVNTSAQASAELARRMQRIGNFSKLQRARQQVFYADATTQLASARHATTAAREELIRALGLDDAQAAKLALPARLPDLPKIPREAKEVAATATEQRLDVQLARAQLDLAGQSQGISLLSTFIDVEAGARRDTVFDNAEGSKSNRRGFELDIRLPLFDGGSAQRDALNAQSLAAANRYDATVRGASSQLREGYSAYRTAYDIAKHYRDEIVPLRQAMADENVLRYNGMLIGVFELLAEARDQIAAVTNAINAQQQFWQADAALAASVMGKPTATGAAMASSGSEGASTGAAH